tara:strand:- start:73 stop:816 length:744 start_codon:yes stop_codon:yes gene_type:complete
MSRFDRRLKGAGLKPGESTCNINSQRNNYAGMNWNRQPNSLGVQNRNVQLNNIQSNIVPQNNVPSNSGSSFVPTLTSNADALNLEEKNLKLAEVEKNAPTTEMRLITRHEIRLNNLEASVLTNNDLGLLSNNKLQEGVFDNALNMMESNFLKKVTQMEVTCKDYTNTCNMEMQKKLSYLQSVINDMKNANDELKRELESLKNYEVDKSNKVRLIVEDKEDQEESSDDDDIKKVVSEAINDSILKMEN